MPTDSPIISKSLTYTIQLPLGDDDDFSKRMNVTVVAATSYTLWYRSFQEAGGATESLDITNDDSVGVYIQVDAATTISVEVNTINGWQPLYMLGQAVQSVFTGADFEFINIWLLPFTEIRFVTSAAATITIQCVRRE